MKNHLLLITFAIFWVYSFQKISWAQEDMDLDSRFDPRFSGTYENIDDSWQEHFPGLLPELYLRQVHIFNDGTRKGEGFIYDAVIFCQVQAGKYPSQLKSG